MKRLHTTSIVTVFVCLAALTVAGVSVARDLPFTTATGSPLSLSERVLQPNELRGFVPMICPIPETDATRWGAGYLSVDGLHANGFVAGLREQLHSQTLGADALSVVAQFRSAQAARAEMQHELAAMRVAAGSYVAFPVENIPGARGFTFSSGGSTGYNVMFTDGPFQYLVGAGFAASASKMPTRAQVIAAATTLYRNVHGHPAA
jgi:hypothetical protein